MDLLQQFPHALRNAAARLMAAFFGASLSLASLITASFLLAAAIPACAYSDNGDGTVTDPTTALTWMRCAMGQVWTGSTCTGTASPYTWDQAVALTGTVSFAGNNDWRLPNIRELQTLADRSRSPAMDLTAFPNTSAAYFRSASAYAGDSSSAWLVAFDIGYATALAKSDGYSVRLVRGGQSFVALLNAARPTSDYVDHGDGTATHTPTGLMWQRCVKGQSWVGSTCSGSATSYSWNAAVALTDSFAGHADWHLPTVEQLLSLADYSAFNFALNAAIFPVEPESDLWSASAYAGNSSAAWGINFHYGMPNYTGKAANYPVRLVRASSAAPTLQLVAGWNLLGNSSGSPINAATTLGDASKITTVWTWLAAAGRWAVFSPSLTGAALANYASANSYDVLTAINSGEGFWVNARTAFTLQLPAGAAFTSASLQNIASGWTLVAIADSQTPSQLNQGLSSSLGAAGKAMTSAWAWDAAKKKWKFFAPALEAQGGAVLADYISGKNYLPFGAALSAADGFWLNIGAASPVVVPPTYLAGTSCPVDSNLQCSQWIANGSACSYQSCSCYFNSAGVGSDNSAYWHTRGAAGNITGLFDCKLDGGLSSYEISVGSCSLLYSARVRAFVDSCNPPTYSLTLSVVGSGTVTRSTPGPDYAAGEVVTLTAQANAGSTFAGWSGACSGTGSCVVTMDGAKAVTASFSATPASTDGAEVFAGSFGGTFPTERENSVGCKYRTSFSATITAAFSSNGDGTIIWSYPTVTGTYTKTYSGCGISPTTETARGTIEGDRTNVMGTFGAGSFSMDWSGTRNGNAMTLTGAAKEFSWYSVPYTVADIILTKR